MSLMDDFKSPCILLDRIRRPDGAGGWDTTWVEGPEFIAGITFSTSLEARTAEKIGVTSLYSVYTDKKAALEYHDVFKRVYDGKIFRVTSDGDDKQTPARASFQFSMVTAEEWALPDPPKEEDQP